MMGSEIAYNASFSKAAYFFAGALLPTLAYVLLGRGKPQPSGNSGHDESDSEDEMEPILGMRASTNAKNWGILDAPYKMILCVNKDLKMGKGKIAAQCCHAAVGCYKRAMKQCPAALRAWERTGCAKVAVQCPTEAEMEEISIKAHNLGIPVYLVEDAGRTQIAAGSRTVLGLGPAPVSMFEGLTSHLKLM